MMEVLEAARKTGKAAGKHCASAEEVSMRIAQGFQFLALSSDAGLMSKAAREEFDAIDFTGESSGKGKAEGKIY